MALRERSGWANLKIEQLEELEQEDFEDFCFDLVRVELYDRHDDPPLPEGPAGPGVTDGGRDILVTIRKPPHESRTEYSQRFHLHPLTEDRSSRTAYSCKSGTNWLDLALRDIEKREAPGRTVEVLLEGGYFKLFLNVVGKLDAPRKESKRTAHAHIAAAFWQRMKQRRPDAEDPADRIEILDAHALADFLRARQPEVGSIARWLEHLDLIPVLEGLAEWRAHHRSDREEPDFVEDPARAELRNKLAAFLSGNSDPSRRVAWLVGPPGVGKTRLLIQTLLENPTIEHRVRIARDPDEAQQAWGPERLLHKDPSAVLIVDDCPAELVGSLAKEFRAKTSGKPNARLLLITPASDRSLRADRILDDASPIPLQWALGAMDVTSARLLAAQELKSPDTGDEQIREIVHLSERYPWFITLLARQTIAEGRSPRDIREAAKWAIASSHEAKSGLELEALRLRRARSLLAASLTRRIDWDEDLSEPSRREALAHAVGLARWQELMDAARECVSRGILRRNHGWHYKYVTPVVLEREVIAWLLDEDGPDPGGRTLTRYGKEYLSDFFETLARLDLPSSVVSTLSRATLDDLGQLAEERGALQSAGMLGARLRFLVRHQPAASARELRRRLERLDLDELRARTDERRDLVFALEELVARDASFDDAEQALFRLAQAENESYGNNATATWSGLFLPELALTYRSVDARMDLLARRLSEPSSSARQVALGGLQSALSARGFRRAIEALDGQRPTPTPGEAAGARVRAWGLLAERFADSSTEVARRARRVGIDELRSAVRTGIGSAAMTVLAAQATRFDDMERVQLRDALAYVKAHDTEWAATFGPALEHLENVLFPESFRERIHQHLGTWGPAASRKDAELKDDALAREGLAEDTPIVGELDWILSEEAVRAHVFAFALGRCDDRAVLLPDLIVRARSAGSAWKPRMLLSRYLGGWKESGRAVEADAVLRELRASPLDADTLALAVIELGATSERLAWIEAAVRAGHLTTATLSELGRRRHWLEGVSEEAFESFACTLLDDFSAVRAAAALELLVDQWKEHPARADALRPMLLRALERLSADRTHGATDYYWELGAELLIEQGDAARVAELAVVALSRDSGSNEHAWNALHGAAEREPIAAWRAVAAALERPGPEAGRLHLAFMFHRGTFGWPLQEVLSWVGGDQRRGRTVVALVPRGEAGLDSVLRGLLQRFGPRSSVANEILARAHSTNGLVSSLATHDAEQLQSAGRWLHDPDSNVRKFAQRLVESLERSHAYHAAEEEDERRRWGT